MDVEFKLVNRENPIIAIEGYVDVEDGSDYCINFYDSYGDICFRIPLNPYNYYSDEYYMYLDLVYYFETDEEFMPILEEFAESEYQTVKIQGPDYDLVLNK